MRIVKSSYEPRQHFLPFHARSKRYAILVCHRGAGKTVACINELVTRATYTEYPLARYAYIAPLRNQAKKIAWDYLKTFSGELISNKSEADLSVDYGHNSARVSLFGADNPDAIRGNHFNGVIIDEYADMSPSVWSKIILPALQTRLGWVVFIGTPKGRNHFHALWERAQKSPRWFTYMLRASESGVLHPEILEEAKEDMTDDEYEQEYECSFEAAVVGTYYSKLVVTLERLRRIGNPLVEWDPNFPVSVNMDIGFTDSAAAWFWQARPDGIAVIDYEEENGTTVGDWDVLLRSKGYEYDKLWLPHDARAKTFASGRSTIEQFIELGHPVDIVPNLRRQHGIDAARKVLPMCYFSPACEYGVDALRSYRRKWNPELKVFSNEPQHDWSSHGADAFRYLSLVAQQRMLPPPEPSPDDIRRGREIKLEPWTLDELWKEHEDRNGRRKYA